jgi:enoyl-CoA hydratase/carnithine racemase
MITGAGYSFCSGGDIGGMGGDTTDSKAAPHQRRMLLPVWCISRRR